jgi:hypothetical protein
MLAIASVVYYSSPAALCRERTQLPRAPISSRSFGKAADPCFITPNVGSFASDLPSQFGRVNETGECKLRVTLEGRSSTMASF